MILLYEFEILVLEKLREGLTSTEISKLTGIKRGSVGNTIARLNELSVIERLGAGKYLVLINEYQLIKTANDRVTRFKREKIPITPEQESYIRKHVKTTRRSLIAKSLNLDKVTLNLMIIQLGLGMTG